MDSAIFSFSPGQAGSIFGSPVTQTFRTVPVSSTSTSAFQTPLPFRSGLERASFGCLIGLGATTTASAGNDADASNRDCSAPQESAAEPFSALAIEPNRI